MDILFSELYKTIPLDFFVTVLAVVFCVSLGITFFEHIDML